VLPFTSISPESFVVLIWGLGWAAEGRPCRESKYRDRHYMIAFCVLKSVWADASPCMCSDYSLDESSELLAADPRNISRPNSITE